MDKVRKSYSFLKTTAIGGLLFLLPLVVISALLGQLIAIVMPIAQTLSEYLPIHTVAGISLLVGLSIAILLLLCFFAGIIARRSIGLKFSQFIEKQVMMLFPRYAIYKDHMVDNIGGSNESTKLTPVKVTFDDYEQLALEVERSDQGLVTIYLPGSPDAWSGTVAIVPAARVHEIDVTFSDLVSTHEKLGRDTVKLLDSSTN